MGQLITNDFRGMVDSEEVLASDKLDARTGIFVRSPTYTIDSYIRYVDVLKRVILTPNTGLLLYTRNVLCLLELGFIPLVMPPSFWGDAAHMMILKKLPKELPYYTRQAFSLVTYGQIADYPDIWVSKMDVARLFGVRPESVTVKGVLEYVGC